jgi:Flp pilus assembly protein TadG
MMAFIMRLRRFVTTFHNDTSGIIMPYVAILMVVFIGLGALALDGGRFMSTQTQMQGVADALSIAGARELDQRSGARARATSAIDTLVNNGLTGLGYNGAVTHAAPVFYSALPTANAGFTGTPATSDQDARFVAVTVNPVTVPTLMPIPFFKAGAANNFSTGARAIAGFKNRAVCGISPMFICNPYETSGMTDAQATAALSAALDPNDPGYNQANARKLFRMPVVGNNTSPGHFGWLQTPNNVAGCNPNSTPCLNELIAYDSKQSLSRSCFDGSGVVMATGNKPVPDAFNDRFDIYTTKNGPSADFTPAINVRKGFKAGVGKKGAADWCSASPGDYLSAQSVASATVPLIVNTTNLAAVTNSTTFQVASGTYITAGMAIALAANPSALLSNVKSINGTTVTVTSNVTLAANTQLNFNWLTAPLPLDRNWASVCSGGTCLQGDGNWDCLHYWNINHPAGHAPPAGCTASNPTVSRYAIYTAENSQANNNPAAQPPAAANDINDWSGFPPGTLNVPSTETGAPMCAINSGFTPTFDSTYDPRVVHVAVINCLAQANVIGGGNSGNPVPAAGFAKFFLTQPYNSDNQSYLYGEMTGLVNSLDQVRIMNQVQLYR